MLFFSSIERDYQDQNFQPGTQDTQVSNKISNGNLQQQESYYPKNHVRSGFQCTKSKIETSLFFWFLVVVVCN